MEKDILTLEKDIIPRKSVPLYEQETHIYYMRDEKTAKIYTSDSTQITKFDKLCKENPQMYQLIEDTGWGKTYLCQNKNMISIRKKKRVLTEAQKQLAAERMKNMHSSKIL
ncbi:hypothetical protein H8S37_04485 [Mediterraneibacter sp. NSJ-55]|uniref:Uncharacterized protein n=1 Tax=Mediterraneibacter hominis TaxID=2763054 RepID=A0A923LHJ9_9FIRM|nr:hypothetical protein [Mediterraneibacter hominis]MBC5688191.1 hypothetical protein [Mediterraneibacter hominis]